MGRPADWSPLAGADPVPGDPDEVAALGRRFRATAAEIEQAAARLRTMCTDEFWDSDAGAAFRQRSVDTAGKLAKAYARYEAAATALGTDVGDSASTPAQPRYAGVLYEAQRLSAQALTSAQDAAATQRQAISQLHTAMASAGGQPPLPGALDLSLGALTPDGSGHLPVRAGESAQVTVLKGQYNTAADQLAAARGLLARATQLRDEAAHHASALISDVISHDGLTDGFWDHVTNFIDEHAGLLSSISKVASWVATIAGTLALAVGWIPVVGQALAAVLGTIALIASVVTLIADGLLAIGGKGSWLDVGLDVIAVASFGLGRAATGALRDSALLARGTAATEGFASEMSTAMSSDAWLRDGEEGLDEVLPGVWDRIHGQVGDVAKAEIEAAQEHTPGAWPKWGGIVRGFHPVNILRDGFGDIGELKLSNWAELAKGATWKGARFYLGDPEIHEALAGVDKLKELAGLEGVRGFVANVAVAEDAFGNGGIELYVSLQTAAGFPLSAALVVTLTPPPQDGKAIVSPARLAKALAGDGRDVSLTELPAGPAVRVWREDPPVTNLDLHIPVPGSGSYLLLSFSTPLAPLASALVGMFDAIAGTLRWIP